MPIALLLLLLLGGGTGVWAENSLPGDVLYPVKIHINENIESALTVTSKGDAEVSVRQAARRLVEAEKLKEKGELSSEQSFEIKNSFLGEVESLNKNLQKIKEKGDTDSVNEISSKFEKEIEDHSDAFVAIGGNSTSTAGFARFREVPRDEDSDGDKPSSSGGSLRVRNSNDDSVSSVRDDEGDDEDEDRDGDRGGRSIQTGVVSNPPSTPPSTGSGTNVTTGSTLPKYTMAQVATHKTSGNCWSVVNGGVYNLTSWISQHPGGSQAIIGLCGIDGTSAFLAQHGGAGKPEAELASFKIGLLQ